MKGKQNESSKMRTDFGASLYLSNMQHGGKKQIKLVIKGSEK